MKFWRGWTQGATVAFGFSMGIGYFVCVFVIGRVDVSSNARALLQLLATAAVIGCVAVFAAAQVDVNRRAKRD